MKIKLDRVFDVPTQTDPNASVTGPLIINNKEDEKALLAKLKPHGFIARGTLGRGRFIFHPDHWVLRDPSGYHGLRRIKKYNPKEKEVEI